MNRSSLLTAALTALVAAVAACGSAQEGDQSQGEDLSGCPRHFTKKHGDGTVLTDVGVVNVYWGAFWSTDAGRGVRTTQDATWTALAADPRFYRPLQEYAPDGASFHGSYLGGVVANDALAAGTALTADALEAELAREIASGALPSRSASSGDAIPVYFLYLAPGVTGPDIEGASPPNAYAAYHHRMTLPGSGDRIAYGVAIYDRVFPEADFAESHELIEMITNPFDDAWSDRIKNADGLHDELADACESSPTALGNTIVAQVWSQRSCACVSP